MARQEIVADLARRKAVERIARNLISKASADTLAELSQTVYTLLLTYPADRIEGMHARGELAFWIVRVLRNQYNDGPFARTFRTYGRRAESLFTPLGEERFADDEG